MEDFLDEPIREVLALVDRPNPDRLNISLHYSKPNLSPLGSLKPLIYVDFVGFFKNLFPPLTSDGEKLRR